MVAHDVKGLMKLMGGKKAYVKQLEKVFDLNQFDMANEPDIGYPFLFNYVKGQEWKTQKKVQELMNTYFKNTPDGLPGNDDTGTMSAWLVYTMMGIYPVSPAQPIYAITIPVFDKITITLDDTYYNSDRFVIEKEGNNNQRIQKMYLNGKLHKNYFLKHKAISNGTYLKIVTD